MAQLSNQDDFIKTALRLPRDLHAAVQEAAKANNRSMNAEIVARLERSFSMDSVDLQRAQISEPDPQFLADIEKRADEWGCSKTQALIRMTIEEISAKK